MNKDILIVIFLLSDVLCLGSMIWLHKYEHRLKRLISGLLGISCLTITMYLLTIVFNEYTQIKVAFCLYFALMDWLCGVLFYFTVQFTNVKYNPVWKRILIPILAVDSLSMIADIWFDHVLDFEEWYWGQGLFLRFNEKTPFFIHMGICYLLILGIFAIFIWKIINEPKINFMPNMTIFIILLFIIFVNAVFVFSDLMIDVSILAYGFGALLITYYTILFVPRHLLSKMSGILLDSFHAGIVLFDEEGNIIYENKETDNWEGMKGEDKSSIFSILKIEGKDELKSFTVERSFPVTDGIRTLSIQYSPLTEKNRTGELRLVGSYLVMDDISKNIERMMEREYNVTHDSLTGMFNRSYFFETVPVMLEQNPKCDYSIFMTNIYQFKLYNEIFGSDAGDELLKRMAAFITGRVKEPEGICARYDADRFVICFPTKFCTTEEFENYQKMDLLGVEGYKLVNYLGICNIKRESEAKIDVLCERAGIALNTVKGDGTRRFAFYDESMREELIRDKTVVNSFENALENGEIMVYIQPQINQISGELVGGEVLARWIKKDGSMISPGEFIPILERHGLVTTLDCLVWERSVKIAKELLDAGTPISLSVNISAQDFYRCNIFEVFTGLCKNYNLPEKYIKMEITESDIMNDTTKIVDLIKRLQSRGFRVEMDDFGSGYSSLNSLKDIPVDVLKMDLRFLENTDDRVRSNGIIKTIILLAKTLDIPVIAEGVETSEQAELLKDFGCNYIQGFLFGKPMSVDEFVELRSKMDYKDIC